MARRERIYNYIYKIIRLFDGEYYFGMHSTDNLEDGYFGSGKRIRYSVNKYGVDAHQKEILEYFPTRHLLQAREREIVSRELIKEPMCMNIMEGGYGGFISVEQQAYRSKCGGVAAAKTGNRQKKMKWLWENDKEWHDKLSLSRSIRFKGHPNWFFHHSDESKQKIGQANSISQKGDGNSQYGTCWITNGIENKKIKKIEPIPESWSLGRSAIGQIGKNQFTKSIMLP